MDILNRIKRITGKAAFELHADALVPQDAVEAILNAQEIEKTIRSRSSRRARAGEKLYVIKGCNYAGTFIYTKGAIKREAGRQI